MIKQSELDQFSGSEHWYRHWTRRLIYTDGIHYLMENGAAWLVDAIASYQGRGKLADQNDMLWDFQLWWLKVDLDKKSAVLTCRADDGCKPVIRQNIEYTDFPLAEIKLYVERGEHLTLMLPSER